MNDKLVIQLNGLPDGNQAFHWDLGQEFFASFENSDILDARVGVNVKLWKSGDCLEFDVTLDGTVTVPCDRCLAPLDIDVEDNFNLTVKLGELPGDAEEYDLSQDVYDYSCLAIPLRRVHEEGECDPEVVKHLGCSKENATAETPFASLGALLGKLDKK